MKNKLSRILLLGGVLIFSGFYLDVSAVYAQKTEELQRNLRGRNDRPYDAQLVRLAELLGAIHYLRELCGANEGQVWRDQMAELVKSEGSTPKRRVKLVNSFNKGYRGYRRTYRSCTQSAQLAVTRSMKEGATLAKTIVTQNK